MTNNFYVNLYYPNTFCALKSEVHYLCRAEKLI